MSTTLRFPFILLLRLLRAGTLEGNCLKKFPNSIRNISFKPKLITFIKNSSSWPILKLLHCINAKIVEVDYMLALDLVYCVDLWSYYWGRVKC